MNSGFYDLSKLSSKQLKAFFTRAVMLSYDTHIDILDCKTSWQRQRTDTKTIGDMINDCSPKYHNVCINRSIQNPTDKTGEVGYTIISGSPSYFLYIYLTIDNLNILIDEFKLIERP